MTGQIAVSVKTAAALLDLSESTIRDAINKQELPAYRVGRSPRIKTDDLEAWIDGRVRVGSEDDQ